MEQDFKISLNGLEAIRWDDIKSDIEEEMSNINNLPISDINKLVKIKSECERREKDFGILYYKPQKFKANGEYAYQESFHKDIRKIRLILGGNQSGKTEAAVVEGILLSLGIHPYRQIRVPNKGRVIATDLDKGIGEVISAKYDKFLPISEVSDKRKYQKGQIKKIFYKNGSTVEFLSYEQGTNLFEGWTGDWVQFDEPPPRDKYIATLRGLIRYKGIFWIAMTPLHEPWIYDEIYLKAYKGNSKIGIYTFDIRDNEYLTSEEIEDYEDKLSPDEKEARLYGNFKHLSGLIYKEFSSEHRIKSFEIPKDWTRYCAMDYHPRVPCAIIWAAVDNENIIYFYDELWIDKGISSLCEAIIAKETEHGVKPVIRVIDSISATPDRITGRSPLREIFEYSKKLGNSLSFRSSDKNWVVGKNTIEEYLKIKNGKAGMYFFEDKVPRAINAMLRYQWDEYAGTNNYNLKKEQPVKAFHFCDAIRYIAIMKPKYRREVPKKYIYLPKTYANEITGYSYGG